MRAVFIIVTMLALMGGAGAQSYIASNGMCCMTISQGTVTTTSSACCTSSGPDDSTIARWAAKKAVARQLDWYDEKKVEKLDRTSLDEMQERIDALCKWAQSLSNHIFRSAYIEWGADATYKLNERRQFLDKMDVAESLVTGLPKPPSK